MPRMPCRIVFFELHFRAPQKIHVAVKTHLEEKRRLRKNKVPSCLMKRGVEFFCDEVGLASHQILEALRDGISPHKRRRGVNSGGALRRASTSVLQQHRVPNSLEIRITFGPSHRDDFRVVRRGVFESLEKPRKSIVLTDVVGIVAILMIVIAVIIIITIII